MNDDRRLLTAEKDSKIAEQKRIIEAQANEIRLLRELTGSLYERLFMAGVKL